MAFCHSKGWQAPSGLIKSTPNYAKAQRVGALAVRFSGPSERDISGEYFSPDCDFGPNLGNGVAVLINHGMALSPDYADFADVILGPATVRKTARGLFAETTLNLEDPLQAAIADLVSLGCLRWSSGSANHLVRKTDAGEIRRWHVCEFSLTSCPCEPRLPALRNL